jgi:hypothetical protein
MRHEPSCVLLLLSSCSRRMVCVHVGLVCALLLLFVSVLCALLLLLLLLFVGCVSVFVLGIWVGPLRKFVTGGSCFL